MIALALMVAYAIDAGANVVAETAGATGAAATTKVLLMPLLLGWLLAASRPPRAAPLRWLGLGVGFAWLGDLLLLGDGDLWFAGGLGAFLVMQVCYLRAFSAVPGPGLVRAWKVALVPYVAVWVVMNAVVAPGVGDLRIPVLVYSAVLLAMAVSALDLVLRVPRRLGWRVACGAGLFVVSDALIAMTAFGPLTASPTTSALIMATYSAAQAMIVTGLTRATAVRP